MNTHFQLTRIQNYLSGRMNAAEMHALEREALEDPFLQDALEGYKLQQGVDAKQLSLLQQRLARRVERKAVERNQQFFSWQRLAIGAIAGVLFVVACVFMLLKNSLFQVPTTTHDVALTHPFEETIELVQSYSGNGADAFPLNGWHHLNSYFVAHSKVSGVKGKVLINFNISDGHPTTIAVKELALEGATDSVEEALIAELKDLLTAGPTWSGKQGELVIIYH